MPKYLDNLPSDGLVFGQTVSAKLGFWGLSTAIVQPSASAQAAVTATVTTTTPVITAFGFASAQAGQIITAINENQALVNAIRSALVAAGIMKGSA
jgi:hypothetical protein